MTKATDTGETMLERVTSTCARCDWRGPCYDCKNRIDLCESEITRTLDALAKDVEGLPGAPYPPTVFRKMVLKRIAKHRPKDGI